MTDTKKVPVEKVKLTVSQILADLDAGLDRKQIRAKYNLNAQGIKQLFQHEKLKGRKVKAPANFDLVDDTPAPTATKTAAPKQAQTSNAAVTDDTAKPAAEAQQGVW